MLADVEIVVGIVGCSICIYIDKQTTVALLASLMSMNKRENRNECDEQEEQKE